MQTSQGTPRIVLVQHWLAKPEGRQVPISFSEIISGHIQAISYSETTTVSTLQPVSFSETADTSNSALLIQK